ncbi:MAG: M81 family metallopeptidase [Bryobacterales bacterium]|nr:M81 family metallopeptidase [Bryobacteraceae bacterium]MDW8354325.1 M81 family metallopeptidase [Bryobacterales bacterium]
MLANLARLIVLMTSLAFSQSRPPRVAVTGIIHESNSFNPVKTTLADFGWPHPRHTQESFLARYEKANDFISGYIEGARKFGLELVPLLIAEATPRGPVSAEAFETMSAEIIRSLRATPDLSGVFLALHGAMVVETFHSGDAELTARVRKAMGPDFPIVVTHDFHANVTERIVRDSTVLITGKENPHLDTRERGLHAARLMAGILSGRLKPVQRIAKPPMIYNIVFQNTNKLPLRRIVGENRALEQKPGVLAVSTPAGYQYADIPHNGPSAIVVTDGQPELAEAEARRLADLFWATRDELRLHLPGPAEAVRMAMAEPKFPVVLMDLGDNIGGGSAGDSTFLLAELIRQQARGWVVNIADPEAVRAAVAAGVGGAFDMEVGGKTDDAHGRPVRVRGRVKSLHDGNYIEPEVRHGGTRYYRQGLTAVIEVEGSTPDLASYLHLTTLRSSPNSLHQLISCGIYPERQRILVVKGAIAPRAAYEPIAARIIEVDTPGATAVNTSRFHYKNVRRPIFGIPD